MALTGKRIGLLSGWTSHAGGGVFEAVISQAKILQSLGAVPVIFGVRDSFGLAPELSEFEHYALRRAMPSRLAFAPALDAELYYARLDALHQHGIWQYTSLASARWAGRTGQPLLISPHGMLDPWITSRGRPQKLVARWLYESQCWQRAAAFHALTPDEASDVTRETGRSDCLIIPNAAPPLAQARPTTRANSVLYLGRIHPKKNLEALLDGWDSLAPDRPADARLVIAGWGEPGHVAELHTRIGRASAGVEFVGPVRGEEKARLLREARFLILPSISEGLPMAILESWASGTPVLMSSHCHLPEGFAQGAALDCGTCATSVAKALGQALRMDGAQWAAMSRSALDLARGQFSQEAVKAEWQAAYVRLLQPTEGNGGR